MRALGLKWRGSAQGQSFLGWDGEWHHSRVLVSADMFFSLSCNLRTRGHSYKLFLPDSRINCRQHFFRCACRKNLEFLTRRYSFSWSSIVVCSSFKSCKFEWVFNWKKLDVHVLWYVRFVYFCGFYLDLYNYLYIFYMATCKRLKCPSFGHSIRVNSTVLIFVYYISFALIGLK